MPGPQFLSVTSEAAAETAAAAEAAAAALILFEPPPSPGADPLVLIRRSLRQPIKATV